jgi:transcriptional regulator with XRE-family HTH domain
VRLAAKLRQIRTALGLTQQQMFERLGETKTALYPGHISLYELGRREPPLPVLLQYSRIAGVPMDVLVDDGLELPKRLPAETTDEWVMVRRERPVSHSKRSRR